MNLALFASHLAWQDYVAFFGYFIALAVIGYVAGKKKKEDAEDYFLAGRSLPWYVVGSSYIAANISTEHFIGLIGAAVIYGICAATGEWSTVVAFTFLIWLYVPFLLSSKVYTAPEFLEKRFNKPMRTLFAAVTLIVNVFAFLGPVIYGGALVVEQLFGIGILESIILIAVLSGFWAIWGGLKSIALMDVLTIVVMVFGGLSVTYLGFLHLGGDDGLFAGVGKMIEVNRAEVGWAKEWVQENVPYIINGAEKGDDYNRLLVLQPWEHNLTSWVHWVFSFFYIGLWYTAINQHMIQKVLAAKDMYNARMGMVFASGLKLLLPFFVVIPGLIFFAMNPEMLHPTQEQLAEINPEAVASGDAEALSEAAFAYSSDAVNKTYIVMIQELVPVFLTGILLAALFGAIQSTVCSVLNSTSTVFTLDFYKMFINKNATQKQEIAVGRIAGTIILFLSILMAYLLATKFKQNLFFWIQMLYVFFAPPFSATFLVGTLWKKVSGFDALLSTIVALGFAIILKILENLGMLPDLMMGFVMQGLSVWGVCMIVLIISALISSDPDPEQVSDGLTFNWAKMSFGEGLGDKWYKSVLLWWAICLGMMFFFVALFTVIL
ncbi:MAG: sodium/solute symporter [Opitutales bacterium]|nr:sodium/solute symporter [Opitutales bacterium]